MRKIKPVDLELLQGDVQNFRTKNFAVLDTIVQSSVGDRMADQRLDDVWVDIGGPKLGDEQVSERVKRFRGRRGDVFVGKSTPAFAPFLGDAPSVARQFGKETNRSPPTLLLDEDQETAADQLGMDRHDPSARERFDGLAGVGRRVDILLGNVGDYDTGDPVKDPDVVDEQLPELFQSGASEEAEQRQPG